MEYKDDKEWEDIAHLISSIKTMLTDIPYEIFDENETDESEENE